MILLIIFIDREQEGISAKLTAYSPFSLTLLFLAYIFLVLQKIMTWSKERFGNWFFFGYTETKISLLELFGGKCWLKPCITPSSESVVLDFSVRIKFHNNLSV